MKRRDFIKALPLGVAAVGVPFSIGGFAGRAFGRSPMLDSILNGSDGSDRILVLINLQGGNDGLNTVIPYNDPVYGKSRPTIGFGPPSYAALQGTLLSSSKVARPNLAFNPSLAMASGTVPSFYDLFTAGKVAVVNNVGYPSPNLSHFRSTDIWNTASDSNVVLTTGWLGRYLEEAVDTNYPADVKSGDDPLAITIGGASSASLQGTTFGMGIAVLDPSNYLTAGAPQTETTANTNAGVELAYVRGIYEQSDIYATQFSKYFTKGQTPKNNVAYPATSIATQLQRVAWCIAAGMKTKVYFVQLGGFDTHINQNAKDATAGQGQLLMQLGQAIAAFQTDIEKAGMADRVIGMTYSEFGRRVNENGSGGTDHGTSAPQFLFGSQINGEVYSSSPDLVNLDSNADLVWKVDFRQLYTSVLGDWFGVSQQMRKAILMDKTTGSEQFVFNIPVNGSSTIQSLIKTPATQGVQSSPQDLDFVLNPNHPNPFTSSTTISFALARTMPVKLEVYSERGDRIAQLANATLGRGTHEFVFAANGLGSGTYICRLAVGDGVVVRQMKVVK